MRNDASKQGLEPFSCPGSTGWFIDVTVPGLIGFCMLFPLSLALSETLGDKEQAEGSDEDVGDVTQKRMTRATLAVRDDYSDSDEDHYVQFEDPGFFMGTRNKDHGDVFTASEDSDIQSGVPQGVQWEPVVEEHTSPRVERSSSEIPSQPLRRSARNTCWPIHYHNGTYLLYPYTFKGLYGIFDTDKTSEKLDSIRDTCDNGTWMQNVCPNIHPLQTVLAASFYQNCYATISFKNSVQLLMHWVMV